MNAPSTPSPRLSKALLALLLVGIGSVFFAFLFQSIRDFRERELVILEKGRALPPFELLDSTQKRITRDDLKGQIWIAHFIFTRCPDVCPKVLQEVSELQTRLRKTENVRLVTITVDPDHDTPEVMRVFSTRLYAQPDRWMFLTGDRAQITRLLQEGFMAAATVETETGFITHSSRLYLVDWNGVVRNPAGYDGMHPEVVQRVLSDLSFLMDERARSAGDAP